MPQLLEQASRDQGSLLVVAGLSGAGYVLGTAALHFFTGYLVSPGRFPFALHLGLCQSGLGTALAALAFLLRPEIRHSLSRACLKDSSGRGVVFARGFLPVVTISAMQLALCNTAYESSAPTAGIAVVYFLAVAFMVEVISWQRGLLLLFVVSALATGGNYGSLRPSGTQFEALCVVHIFSCLKIFLQGLLVCDPRLRLKPIAYLLLVMPACALMLCGLLFYVMRCASMDPLGAAPNWPTGVIGTAPPPTLQDLRLWGTALLANSALAVAVQACTAVFAWHSSPLAFVVAGSLADALIAIGGASMAHEPLPAPQSVAFCVQFLLLLVWSTAETGSGGLREDAEHHDKSGTRRGWLPSLGDEEEGEALLRPAEHGAEPGGAGRAHAA